MKNLLKKLSFLSLVFVITFAIVGCGGGGEKPTPKPEQEYEALTIEEYKVYITADLKQKVRSIEKGCTPEQLTAVQAKLAEGEAAIAAGKNIEEVKAAEKEAEKAISSCIPLASGIFSYSGLGVKEKTEILGVLEEYCVNNNLTGISLFENGGYVMYNPRVVLGTENYITGYGFGLLAEGSLSAPLEAEANVAWKNYLHTISPDDPGTINHWDDQGSQVSDLMGYMGASYYTAFMNSTKDGYDWVPELAKEKPIPMNQAEGSSVATIWRIPVKTSELKYTTNSGMESRQAFNNRPVALEDYLTPYKVLLNAKNNLFRGSEHANSSGANEVLGCKAYYEATKNGEGDFSTVGYRVGTNAEIGDYLEIEFVNPVTQFYAMYYSASSLFCPVPQEFIDLVGVKNMFNYTEDKSQSPIDNCLSLGAYALERWDQDQQIVFKKNPNYTFADTKYAIEGIHINVLSAAKKDQEAVLKEFLAGKVDSCGIPQTRLDEFKSDPRTKTTTGDSVFKLNLNATDAATWQKLFGPQGSAMQTPEQDTWVVEPCMANRHFTKALSLSIDRLTYGSARGKVPSVNFFSSNYMSDPEGGISYDATEAHKNAIAGLLADTDGYGFSKELARQYFRVALAELEAEGAYKPGTKENPTVIPLEIAWMEPVDEGMFHNELKQYFEDTFNHYSVSDGRYKLEVSFWCGANWDDVYYEKLMKGQFDIGFGSISGNPQNPLEFLHVLSSDQTISGNFTLNWGVDTNDPEATMLVYDGKRWSFDALWQAASTLAVVENGVNVPKVVAEEVSFVKNEDGSYTSTSEFVLTKPEETEFSIAAVQLWDYSGKATQVKGYTPEFKVTREGAKVVLVVTISKEMAEAHPGDMGLDIYYDLVLGGLPSKGNYFGTNGVFEAAEPAPAA